MNTLRRPLVCGNWKMNHGGPTSLSLVADVKAAAKELPSVDVVVAPPFTALSAVSHECDGSRVAVAGQNLHPKADGAFTGEVSGPMLKDAGCTWVIIGHSERRQLFGETDESVAEKVRAALAFGLSPIVCVGETLTEREGGYTLDVVKKQVAAVLPILADVAAATAIAYEPVWAIGTGKTAGPNEAEEVHAAIRGWLAEVSTDLAARVRILYGGSVKPDNARGLFACPNVDGALVGGASLDAPSFNAIARAAAT